MVADGPMLQPSRGEGVRGENDHAWFAASALQQRRRSEHNNSEVRDEKTHDGDARGVKTQKYHAR